MKNVRPKIKLTKAYRTRCGYPVTRLEFALNNRDDHPWRAWYRLPDGSMDYGWYTDDGLWSANHHTDVDLIEVSHV